MSNEIKRVYKGTDAQMLTAINTIVQAAIDNQKTLVARRASWADPFLPDLQTEIDTVTQTYIGVDSAKDLRTATQLVTQIQAGAIDALEEVKVQIERDFRDDKTTRDELLNELGYTACFKAAYRKDQGALVNLLLRFKKSLTPDVQTQLTGKGTDAGTLTAITGYADTLNNANISQEGFKSSRTSSTQTAVAAFNNMYNKVMDVAVIAAKFFKDSPATQLRFSYSKVLTAQQGGEKTKTKKSEQALVTAKAN